MKNIFAAIFITCFAFSAMAQSGSTHLLHNYLNDKLPGLKPDTTIAKLIAPQLPGNLYNRFNISQGYNLAIANVPAFADAGLVYSRMPVARLQSGDKMPVANMDVPGAKAMQAIYNKGVKRVVVVDPLGAK